MNGLPWFRMYVDFLEDPKMLSLAFEDQRHFIGVLALKATGTLDQLCDPVLMNRIVAQRLWIDHAAIVEVKRRLIEASLIDTNWQPLAWNKRQFVSDHDPTGAERQRRFRDKKKDSNALRNGQRNGSVTLPDSDSDSDTDPEAEQRGKDVKAHAYARNGSVTLPNDVHDDDVHDDESPLSPSVQVSYSSDFEQAWQLYPTRIGGNSKQIAYRAWQKRLQEGHTVAAMTEGTQRYAAFCQATNVRGTRYVKQAGTFFGPGLHFTEAWIIPPPGDGGDPQPHNASPITQLSKAGQQQVRNAEAWLQQHNVVSAEVLSSELN